MLTGQKYFCCYFLNEKCSFFFNNCSQQRRLMTFMCQWRRQCFAGFGVGGAQCHSGKHRVAAVGNNKPSFLYVFLKFCYFFLTPLARYGLSGRSFVVGI